MVRGRSRVAEENMVGSARPIPMPPMSRPGRRDRRIRRAAGCSFDLPGRAARGRSPASAAGLLHGKSGLRSAGRVLRVPGPRCSSVHRGSRQRTARGTVITRGAGTRWGDGRPKTVPAMPNPRYTPHHQAIDQEEYGCPAGVLARGVPADECTDSVGHGLPNSAPVPGAGDPAHLLGDPTVLFHERRKAPGRQRIPPRHCRRQDGSRPWWNNQIAAYTLGHVLSINTYAAYSACHPCGYTRGSGSLG